MNIVVLACVMSLFAGLAEGPEQDKRKRINELLAQAEQENKKGNAAEARKCLAEAWALTSEVYAEQGNRTLASEAWRTAVSYGWKGESPVDRAEAKPRGEERKPPLPEEPRAGTPRIQDEQPSFERTPSGGRSRSSMPLGEPWRSTALAPYDGSRANGWHALLNTPPFEAAWIQPRGTWELTTRLDIATIDFSDDGGGGPSVWHTSAVLETLQVDYGLANRLEAGLRLGLGQVGESDDDRIRVYENGQQIVPTGTRSFGVESVVARAKWAAPTTFADLGILTEFKIPVADEDDFLTSQTMDWGISGLFTARYDRVAFHVNAGVVVPIGDADLFIANDDLDPYVHGAVGVSGAVHDVVSLLAQLEFNTSAFGDVGVLDANVMTLQFGGRYKVTPTFFVGGTVGFGLSDESGDLYLSTSVHMNF